MQVWAGFSRLVQVMTGEASLGQVNPAFTRLGYVGLRLARLVQVRPS
jgi:hypothetical protein